MSRRSKIKLLPSVFALAVFLVVAVNICLQPVIRRSAHESITPSDDTSSPQQSLVSHGPVTAFSDSARNFLAPFSSAMQSAIAPAATWVRHKISRGDTLARIWEQYGASSRGAGLADQALKEISDTAYKLRSGEEIELEVGPDGQISGLKKQDTDGTVILLQGDSETGFISKLIEPEIAESHRTASGIISSSFAAAALQSDIPYDVVDEYVDLFGGRVEFQRALQAGDTFTVEYKERRTTEGKLLEAQILSASIKTGGKLMAALRHDDARGKAVYFDEDGNALGNYFLRYPVKFTRISSVFSDSRFHPVLKIRRPHHGVDFAAPTGTPVRAVADGTVESAGWINGGGNTVKIKHSERWATAYMHLSKIGAGLKKGARISRGQIVGNVGMTGLATAPHLHFSLYDAGKYVNPLTTKLPSLPAQIALPKGYLVAALQNMQNLHTQLESSLVAQGSAGLTRRKA